MSIDCRHIAHEPTAYAAAAELFKALADPCRLAMLGQLGRARGDVCVCEFTHVLPVNQPTVSHHLRVLREARLVTSERRGTWVYYRLAADAQERLAAACAMLSPRVRDAVA